MTKKDEKKEIEDVDYYKQQSKNEYAFRQMLKTVKPDLYVLFDLLDLTGINYFVIIKVIRALNNIAMGNGYGTVSINIENGKAMFVRGEESDRVNEPLIMKRSKEPLDKSNIVG